MKFSLRWLTDYLELEVSVPAMLEKLTMAGAEVEHVETRGIENPNVVVAQILSSVQHPNADRLRVCRVNDGREERQIVCGARNYKDGDKVPLALPGAKLPGGLTIKESKLRGELSQGMLCSAKELAIAEDAEGLLILPPDAPVGRVFHEYCPADTHFEVEITPNRPDLLSYIGMAREMAAVGIGALKPFSIPPITAPTQPSPWEIDLAAGESGPYYTATQVGSVKVGPSPAWLKEKIEAMGHRAINNVVDITNFVLWETGQPLHAFDSRKLSGTAIIVRDARAGEKFPALDEKEYELNGGDLVIADASGPIALAGVMGGRDSSVDESTAEIILESAWFAPARVRRTSRRLGLVSDSSYRFERRADPAAVLAARDRAVQLLIEICGAKVLSSPKVAGNPPPSPAPVELRHARLEQVLGVAIDPARASKWLSALGLKAVSEKEGVTRWEIPSFRADLEREIDLIEEVARLHGLEGIPARIHMGLQRETKVDVEHDRVSLLRSTLASRGWDECLTDALVEGRRAPEPNAVPLANPLNEQYTHLRPALKASLLAVASNNLAKGVKRLRLFEIGRVFRVASDATQRTEEPLRLGLLLAGEGAVAGWWQAERASDFFDMKGTVDLLTERAQLKKEHLLALEQLSAAELKEHGIKTPVFYAEFDLAAWLEAKSEPPRYRPVPSFPAVRRDLAVVVDQPTPHARIAEAIVSAKIGELESVELFDIFLDASGEKIPVEKKSLAYALTYRATDRTLTEKEVNAWHERVRETLRNALACSFRDN